jgi:hypothetical protein
MEGEMRAALLVITLAAASLLGSLGMLITLGYLEERRNGQSSEARFLRFTESLMS